MVPSTISGWLKNVLKSSGINVSLFTSHSTSSTTISKACASGLSMIEIIERGTWSNMSTWQRFYKKDIIPIHVEYFQNMGVWTSVMGGTKWRCEQRKETWSPVRWNVSLKIAVLDQTAILWNKIMELLKGVKRHRVILIWWIKSRKYLILPSHPLHEKYSTAICMFCFVYICFITVGKSFIVKEDYL